MGQVVELQPHLIPSSRLERLRGFVIFAMREIQQSVGNAQHRSIWCHFSEADREHRQWLIDTQIKLDDRCTQYLKPFR